MRNKAILLAIASVFLGVGPVVAQDEEGTNSGDKLDEMSADALATHQSFLASELAVYGRESRNAMALIVAAEMQAQAGGREVEREKTTEGPDDASEASEDDEGGDDMYSVSAMLSDARDLARGDESLLAAIEQVESQESKGRVGGPGKVYERVNARSHDRYRIRFHAGKPAIVTVVGNGRTDLDLRIYDQNGNLVCKDVDYTDRNYCRWQPIWEGIFTIKITNLGRKASGYKLQTN